MPLCLRAFSSNGLLGILKEKDRVRYLLKGHLTLTEQKKRAWEEMLSVIYLLAFLHVSETGPAVSWFCSELHFSHIFLRTNITQQCIRNFLPFPFIMDKSVCTQLLACGKCPAHRFSWHSSVSYLTMPGSLA